MIHTFDGVSYHLIGSCSLVAIVVRERFSFLHQIIMKPLLSVVKSAVKRKMSSSHGESSSKRMKSALPKFSISDSWGSLVGPRSVMAMRLHVVALGLFQSPTSLGWPHLPLEGRRDSRWILIYPRAPWGLSRLWWRFPLRLGSNDSRSIKPQ